MKTFHLLNCSYNNNQQQEYEILLLPHDSFKEKKKSPENFERITTCEHNKLKTFLLNPLNHKKKFKKWMKDYYSFGEAIG